MWNKLAAAGAVVLLGGAVTALALASRDPALPSAPPDAGIPLGDVIPDGRAAPEAAPQDRAARRLARYDRDRDGQVSRDEYLLTRRKAFARIDRDGDGRVSFEEYAAKTADRFGAADGDRSGALSGKEFATTAPKRKPARRVNCPPATVEADG